MPSQIANTVESIRGLCCCSQGFPKQTLNLESPNSTGNENDEPKNSTKTTTTTLYIYSYLEYVVEARVIRVFVRVYSLLLLVTGTLIS